MNALITTESFNQATENIRHYYTLLNTFFLERSEILKLMLTATVAQEPMLFVGRPGTAKSLLVNVFCEGLGIPQQDYFEYMLTKFTEPSEIMGPVDINALKEGRFIRKVNGLLPTAKIAFLDEIFKSNSAILNMLLTIINERKYFEEGRPVPVPLINLFAASNEIPEFSEYDALKDRFILKVETQSVKDKNFFGLIQQGLQFEQYKQNNQKPWQGTCSLEDLLTAHAYINQTILPNATTSSHLLGDEKLSDYFKTLIGVLERELKVEITDRKLIKLYKLIITQAAVFDGGTVKKEHLKILCYCANNFKDMELIRNKLSIYLERLA